MIVYFMPWHGGKKKTKGIISNKLIKKKNDLKAFMTTEENLLHAITLRM